MQPVAGVAPLGPATSLVEREPSFPSWLLNTGFIMALLFATICLLTAGYYLYQFQGLTQESVLRVLNGKTTPLQGVFQLALMAQMYLTRVQLLSCDIFIGMAFGFLGFGLFLLGIKGSVDAEGSSKAFTLRILNLSPGVFVLLCATSLIGLRATRSLPFSYGQNGQSSSNPPNPGTPGGGAASDTTQAAPAPTIPAPHTSL